MTRNEILEVAGQFYRPETITEREIAFARFMMNYERQRICKQIAALHDSLSLASISEVVKHDH
jgi:hypothetical protein